MPALADPKREYDLLKEQLEAAVRRVLASGRYVLDEEVAAFEREFAAFCGVGYGVSTASGTMALLVALKALGVGPGDEVIAPAYTSICTAAAITHAGAVVRFADVSEQTLTLNVADVATRVTERTRAVIPVHLHGQVADIEPLRDLANRHRLAVLEDAALAVGAADRGRPVGSLGDAAAVSFAPTKILGGLGWGGIIITNDLTVATRARQLAGFGLIEDGETALNLEGYNAQMSSLLAAGLRVKLRYLEGWVARRRAIAARFDDACDRLGIRRLRPPTSQSPAPRAYVIRVADQQRAGAILRTAGIEAAPHFVPPLHLRPVYAHLGYRRGDFPVAERAAQELLCLPVHPHLTDSEIDRVVAALEHISRHERGAA